MRPNLTKRKLQENKPAIGIFISAASSLVAEAVANQGLDWVLVDMQHGEANLDMLVPMLQGISTTEATPMARVPYNDFLQIGRSLDLGAYGIVVPLVNSPEEAEAAVRATRYPPRGGRSNGPIRAAIYSGGNYFAGANDEMLLVVMLETEEAIANAPAILAIDGVDGCYIGPSDLSISYGIDPATAGRATLEPAAEEASLAALKAAREAGKFAGMHVFSAEAANRRLEQGFRMIGLGSELRITTAGLNQMVQQINR